jgi:dipeptidyl aminopeptidase/acylaminoacyl peptidase
MDAAVQSLASRGLIDPSRVGLIGFSRAGYLVYYAATHQGQTHLAAVEIADSTTESYGEYVSAAATWDLAHVRSWYENQYGGKSFWQDKTAWIESAPIFNLDRARMPMLLMYNGEGAPLDLTKEVLGALKLNSVPHELLFFPHGTHQLRLPRERQASMQATVDWMSFWLQAKLPAKADRVERWKALKEQQAARPESVPAAALQKQWR